MAAEAVEGAAEEIAEAAESVESVTDDLLMEEFDPSNFENQLSECSSTLVDSGLEKSLGGDDNQSSIEYEFSPEKFSDISDTPQINDSENTSSLESQEQTDANTEVEDNAEVKQIKTINSGLEGQNHPVTDVPFERKVVTTETGEKVEGVFPQFESKFDAQLPEDLQLASDADQFAECNRQLKEKYDSDPDFRNQFDERQKENIEEGGTPYGYTWHHNEETGKMQLVDYDTHQKTAHTGGRSIWGGGSDNR
ncbi:MAG: HNH endonuclease [Muribaculaceae bacterium]|nr:HNH endonuclease [Muribaculaceae bacterium]